ncbi:phosphocholine-specific phospholipase C [Compostibacter hankyongensis]|uniref:phospholipase C n=1 Tax=Compostibacter hankyongensis TaxID=1007089 RepID=A0ABP8FIE0_9BACT
MDTRREFLKKAALLSGAAGLASVLPESIQRAFAIDPPPGSTYQDAEHVVILMQENRSFDHCFGTLQGVRGFNDPRAVTLPDKNLVWLQTNAAGKTYAPFRFDIRDTKITWMGSIPHSRASQVDANNGGRYDGWLEAKRSGNRKYADMPLTLGHYTREDLPFNYALADAFTVCDQNFSSGMTSTWPNRLFFWSGAIRDQEPGYTRAFIRNDLPYGVGKWKTFPERLEENGISWRVYQNDVTCGGGFTGEERSWLSNFGCNPLELFSAYQVRFSSRYVQSLKKQTETLPQEIAALEKKLPSAGASAAKLRKELEKKKEVLARARQELSKWSRESFEKLSPREKSLYERAFTINSNDPYYREITHLSYRDGNTARQVTIPKGDVLHQFRDDVNKGRLPAVSWLVGPANFSDHPSTPWYGAWYVSEILDILTKNPEVWKKTIFILTYDENDGYFDHIPPFVAPDPKNPETGKCSSGIDTAVEYIRRDRELEEGISKKAAREGPSGLGYRVPMVIASPWSRGGRVCSQVFDHTSTLQFLEKFFSKKLNKDIRETNISRWRRTVTGDLTTAFLPYHGEKIKPLPFLEKNAFIESIYNAQFKKEPTFRPLSESEIARINRNPAAEPLMPKQEPGIRVSCALPYELYADGQLSPDKKNFTLEMEAGNRLFGEASAGSPFNVHLPGKYANSKGVLENVGSRSYAVAAGDSLSDAWPLQSFENGIYHLRVYGPNGFFREYRGSAADPLLKVACRYGQEPGRTPTAHIVLSLTNLDPAKACTVEITDHGYGRPPVRRTIPAGSGQAEAITLDLKKTYGWYDFSLRVSGDSVFEKRYAGRVETGKDSYSDPVMGRSAG